MITTMDAETRSRRGVGIAVVATLLGLITAFHAQIPNLGMGVGSLVESFLPWLGLFIPVLLVMTLRRRSALAAVAVAVTAAVWLSVFGGLFIDKSDSGADLTVVSHNVKADNPDPEGTARELIAAGADLLALEEFDEQALAIYEEALAQAYPYHVVEGSVGLWSKLPLSDTQAIELNPKPAAALLWNMGPPRALRTTVTTDKGPLAVYVAHLWSVGVNPRGGFTTGQRDEGERQLAKAIAAEKSERVVLVGDLNGTLDDRAFDGLTSQMRSAQSDAGSGFGFTWPSSFPVVRIDQILVRGVTAESSCVLPATGSDHRPVGARIIL